ncbi:hypothetical protein RCL1_005900 [Eukaryota sp. TZLM3-RCL]
MAFKLANFYTFTVCSFVLLGLVGGFFISLADKTQFVDSFFLSFSSLTVTGLSTHDFHNSSFFSQLVTMVLIQLGSFVVWSLVPVIIRRRYLIKSFADAVYVSQPVSSPNLVSPPSSTDILNTNTEANSAPEVVIPQATTIVSDSVLPLYKYSIEYWALTRLITLIPLYILSLYTISFLLMALRFLTSHSLRQAAESSGGWVFVSFYLIISAFNNAGLSPLSDSVAQFNQDYVIILVLSFLIISGVVGYPFFLRLIISMSSSSSRYAPVNKFLLENGRKIYTHLFGKTETLWLVFWNVVFFFMLFFSLIVFEWEHLPHSGAFKVLNAAFISISLRTAGLATMNLSVFSTHTLILMTLLQIVAAAPFITTLRKSSKMIKQSSITSSSTLKNLFKFMWKQQQEEPFYRDFFWLYFSWFSIALTFYNTSKDFAFPLLFEVSSAYGNVGYTIYPNWYTGEGSFAGALPFIGKVLLIFTMVAGRMRDVPTDVESAATTSTFEGVAEDVLQLMSTDTLARMGIKMKPVQKGERTRLALDPRIEMLLTRGSLHEGSVTYITHSQTFPPKRIMNVRDLMSLQRKGLAAQSKSPGVSLGSEEDVRVPTPPPSAGPLETREEEEEEVAVVNSHDLVLNIPDSHSDEVIRHHSHHHLPSVRDLFSRQKDV